MERQAGADGDEAAGDKESSIIFEQRVYVEDTTGAMLYQKVQPDGLAKTTYFSVGKIKFVLNGQAFEEPYAATFSASSVGEAFAALPDEMVKAKAAAETALRERIEKSQRAIITPPGVIGHG